MTDAQLGLGLGHGLADAHAVAALRHEPSGTVDDHSPAPTLPIDVG